MDKERVIQNWAVAGMKDFYISFEFEAENKWHEYSTFFCHQGLEKICKAYILARSASTWEHLPEDKGLGHVNKMAKQLGHNLKTLLSCLRSRGVLPTLPPRQESSCGTGHSSGPYSEDELIQILEAAYIEARYPTPRSSQVHRQFSLLKSSKLFSHPIRETAPIKYARKSAMAVLNRIELDFSIKIPKDKTSISKRIPDEYWVRFQDLLFV